MAGSLVVALSKDPIYKEQLYGLGLTARRSSQPILKEINPKYSLEGLMLKLKHQYFGHLMGRADSLEKILLLGKRDGKRRTRQQRIRWLDSITNSREVNFSKCQELWRTGKHGLLQSIGSQRVAQDLAAEQLWARRFPWWLSGKESTCLCRRHGFDPGLGRYPGEGNGNPLQYSCWENPMDRGVWKATVHGVTKSQTWLSS